MIHPYGLSGTDYTIKAAPTEAAEEIRTNILAVKSDDAEKARTRREAHLPSGTDSLDSIIHSTSLGGPDVADMIVRDKRMLLRATTELLRNLIDNRSKIRDENITRLEYKISQCGSYLLNVKPWPPYSNSLVEARRANLGHAINRLESEKNQETARCWSDQARLYQELMKTLGDYRAASRRAQLLSGAYR
jgi:hypothetical protein